MKFIKLKKNQKGMTILEMLIAITIFVIGIEGFSILLINTWRSNSYTFEMGQSAMAVSQGVNKIVNYIRGARQGDNGAYPIVSAEENSLRIYSDYDKDGITERLHIYKSDQNILMGITNPGTSMPVTYPSGDQETVTIASSIVNETDDPVFSYYDKNYPIDTDNNPMSYPINIGNVRLIRIYLHINIDPNRAPDNIENQTFVEIRNLNDYNKIQ